MPSNTNAAGSIIAAKFFSICKLLRLFATCFSISTCSALRAYTSVLLAVSPRL